MNQELIKLGDELRRRVSRAARTSRASGAQPIPPEQVHSNYVCQVIKPTLCKALGLPLDLKPDTRPRVGFRIADRNIDYSYPKDMSNRVAAAVEAALWHIVMDEKAGRMFNSVTVDLDRIARAIAVDALERRDAESKKQSTRAGPGKPRHPVTWQQLEAHRAAWIERHGKDRGWVSGKGDGMKNACEEFLCDPATVRTRLREKAE